MIAGRTDLGRRVPITDWLAAALRALGVGLIASALLAAIALLLSGGAAAAEASAPLRAMKPSEAQQGTLLFRARDGASESFVAPLVHTEVDIRVTGFVARTKVAQSFENATPLWQEGIYVFPLPEGAAVDALTMRVGNRVIQGEVRERGAAKATYEQAKQAGQRTALVEQERPNLFTSSVANIGPGERITVMIEYQETVAYERGVFSLRFPMVVGPRYSPGVPTATGTSQVADAGRIAPPVLKPAAGDATAAIHNPVNLRVELDPGMPLASLYAPYHKLVVSEGEGGRHRIALAAGVVPANRDFALVWQPEVGRAPQAAVFRETRGDEHYALVMVLPPAPKAVSTKRLPREAIFVIDTSGSMEGASIVQARDALRLALERLAPEDRFNVIEFNSIAQALFEGAQPATAANVSRARDWVGALRARGGTEMAKALDLALDARERTDVVRQIVFLTDGAVGNEDELFRMIRARLGDSRLFTVGIGSAPNSHFMTQAAAEGRGTFTYIGRVDEVREKMGQLFAKLEAPMLKNVRVAWPGGEKVEAWPRQVPDLYAGEPVFVTARLPEAPRGAVRVSGLAGDTEWATTLKLVDPKIEAGLGKLWARRKIDALAAEERGRGGDAEGLRKQITTLALDHHLVSKYTSLVAVDKTPARPDGAPLGSGMVPTNLPEGWVYEAVFGELPQTATGAREHVLFGFVALLLAMFALAWSRRPMGSMGRRAR